MQSPVDILFGYRDDQPEVGLDEVLLGPFGLLLALAYDVQRMAEVGEGSRGRGFAAANLALQFANAALMVVLAQLQAADLGLDVGHLIEHLFDGDGEIAPLGRLPGEAADRQRGLPSGAVELN